MEHREQMSNKNLNAARSAKNDEFYTLYEDVEKGIEPYKSHFSGQCVLCNCNDGKRSNFYKFFKKNFQNLGLARLICVSYNPGGNGSCIEITSCSGEKEYELKGNGDFRSEECLNFLTMADIVVTNPPFSLFREFIKLLEDHDKKYLVLGNLNMMIAKDIFPLIKEEKAWVVPSHHCMKFITPDETI